MTTEQQPTSRTAREVDLLWGLDRPAPRRGPRPKLSREAVVDAAVAVADAEGLEAVSMQRVAGELGYTTMSLYRHVDSKEDMLVLMSDRAMDGAPPEPCADRAWRAGVEEWVHRVMEVYRRHPWAIRLTLSGPPAGPNGLRWMEAGLREIVRSGLDVGSSLQMLAMLSSLVRDTLRLEGDMARAAREAGSTMADAERDYSVGLRRVVTAEDYPTIALMLESAVLEDQPPPGEPDRLGGPADELDFSIHRVLDGIEVYVERVRAGERPDGGDVPAG
ncbi:TetR/AcrR family transcriptional regulator [Nocardiopsis sp. CT-R113]|uniref:TetR/AcrR family transcriptional regulator n=1 Tax=Nocardiopsis codii TaxID=3065942 RepID=A0ABU7KHQ3_9ACTN|nr:TetR/AcrR family transcriptional regulator [Nocardiopsis sp. CT-R113]MEE2041776.1 TetR/AcrR family transcriptional regulator [Nocardiopsis sp. CT-R113]